LIVITTRSEPIRKPAADSDIFKRTATNISPEFIAKLGKNYTDTLQLNIEPETLKAHLKIITGDLNLLKNDYIVPERPKSSETGNASGTLL
jgi:hypothetical protein